MFRRLRMIFRSLFGWILRGAENPELILRQHMDDLRDQIPKLNQQAAEIIKVEKMLEEQVNRQRAQVAALQPKVEQAVKMGPEAKEAALSLIQALETAKKELAETEAQWQAAKENSQRTLEMRRAYEQRIKAQMNEALRQIGRARRAEMEKQMASLMTSFGIGDQSDTLERMTQRIDEKMAEAKARTTVANETADAQMAKVETAVQNSEAENLYQEYQRQLGLVPDPPPAERTMEAIPLQPPAQEQPQQQAPPQQQQ
ncbi:PspA/IM30 family protein [bacterium]|nr:PspA/IM30 family protein [bacterium]